MHHLFQIIKTRSLRVLWSVLIIRSVLFIVFIIAKVPYRPIVIHSERLMNIISVLGWFPKETAKAAAPFPFVILRWEEHPMNESRLRHETVHHYQMLETFCLLQVYGYVEYLYARTILWYDHMQAYLRKTSEQEAYLHQDDAMYLSQRQFRGFLPYVGDKTPFVLVDYQVVVE